MTLDLPTRLETFAYLATPYSKYEGGLDAAFQAASKVAAEFIRRGVPVFSPIAHSHPVAVYGEIDPLDHSIWLKADQAMMDAASELYIIEMSGWDQSKGIAFEIETFRKAGKWISNYSWPDLTLLSRIRREINGGEK